MKRIALLLSLLVVLATSVVQGQAGQRIDQEYISTCLVDSLANGDAVRFTRILLIGSQQTIDVDILGQNYTPVGRVMTCEEYDLAVSTRNPVAEQYPDCQCTYTISQENHQAAARNGNLFLDVRFLTVVRRQCSGQADPDVVWRDSTINSVRIGSGNKNVYVLNYSNGGFVDNIDFRLYTSATTPLNVEVDLNPATVQTTYPSLALNVSDFTFSGANISAMENAYRAVINHALTAVGGSLPSIQLGISSSGNSIEIRQVNVLSPSFPFLIAPHPDDSDYRIVANNATAEYRNEEQSHETTSSAYSAQCGEILSVQSASFLRWDRLAPLTLLPYLSPSGVSYPAANNPSVTCASPSELCGILDAENGCQEACTEVLDVGGQIPLKGDTIVLESGVYNSISIWVSSGSVQVSPEGSVPINYPTNYVGNWGASPRSTLKNKFTIDATNGEAIITFVR